MAVTDPKSLRTRVTAATSALLGLVPGAQASPKPVAPPATSVPADHWSWDASFLQYMESDRITVSEPQIGVQHVYGDHRSLSILATVDTISGATPLGTLPQTANTATNTTTGPSGRLVSSDVGKVPTTDMSDTRLSLSTSYERPLSEASRGVFGGQVGKEHDFLSLGANATVHRDFNQKNTTISYGLSPEFDWVTPNGGLPYAYGVNQSAAEFQGKTKTKYLVGGLLGLTQIINRRTLMQWNYSPTYENGYLNDPYKLLSLVNAAGDPLQALHESRPGSRVEHSFYWLTRYSMTGDDVASVGLRYMADNWGIHSQTIDFTYRWQYHARRFFEPHVRYYSQSAADFFHVGLRNDRPLPDNASADYRLSKIHGITIGLRAGFTLPNESELILRAEYYTQTGEDRPKDAVGVQRNFDLFPTLNASILQIEYHFEPRRLFTKSRP